MVELGKISEKAQPKESKWISFEAATFAQAESPERENEDIFAICENNSHFVALVADGASALSSVTEAGSKVSGKLASETISSVVKKHFNENLSAKETLILANKILAEEQKKLGRDPETNSANISGASATMVKLDKENGIYEIAQIGDTAAIIVKQDKSVELALPLDIWQFDIDALSKAIELSLEKKISIKETLRNTAVKEFIIRSRESDNQNRGGGSINGSYRAEGFIQTRTYQIDGVERIILLTDGMFPPSRNIAGQKDWQKISDKIASLGIEGYYNAVTRQKAWDKDFSKYPRLKKHDDATAVIIDNKYLDLRREYFSKLALEHIPEMRLLIRGGGLKKTEGWRNVVEHSISQLAASEVLSELLDLSENDMEKLIKVALTHDWKKRIEIKPGEFDENDLELAKAFLARVNPDQTLLAATGPSFIKKALVRGDSTLLERLQFYIDDITKGSEIVSFSERIDEVEARRQDLNEDEELTKKLKGKYWNRERELGHTVEREIFGRLKEKGVEIETPEEIPTLINREIRKRILRG